MKSYDKSLQRFDFKINLNDLDELDMHREYDSVK